MEHFNMHHFELTVPSSGGDRQGGRGPAVAKLRRILTAGDITGWTEHDADGWWQGKPDGPQRIFTIYVAGPPPPMGDGDETDALLQTWRETRPADAWRARLAADLAIATEGHMDPIYNVETPQLVYRGEIQLTEATR